MERTRFLNLPIVGMVQHGEIGKLKELGYFIAKIYDSYMQSYLDKFNEQYKGKQSIDVYFFDEEPFSMKYARYNQGGEVCSCNVDCNIANQKTKDGWQQIECNESCQYRQRVNKGRPACNRIGWLKFLIPSVCKDRIFLMRITSQETLDTFDNYFWFQKSQGISAKGYYTIHLKQKEQTNFEGKTFNNYVLDIVKKDNFIQTNQIPQTIENNEKLSTENVNNVENCVVQMGDMLVLGEQPTTTEKKTDDNTDKNVSTKATTKTTKAKTTSNKETKGKKNKAEEQKDNQKGEQKENKNMEQSTVQIELQTADKNNNTNKENVTNKAEMENTTNLENDFSKFYVLVKTYKKIIRTKNGNEKEYLVGAFQNSNCEDCEICIRPEDAEELSNCELGTTVAIDVMEKDDVKFALQLKYIQKLVKKNVA